MSGPQGIKRAVLKHMAEGHDAETIWRLVQAEMPTRSVAWDYVCKVIRETKRGATPLHHPVREER